MIIGVTGGIGSGKSTVSKILRDLGVKVIDADKISREVVNKGSKAYNEIVISFGPDVLDENDDINRKKLAEIVFNNEEGLKKLENITHKYIIEEIYKKISEIKSEGSSDIIVLDVPIPVKHGFLDLVDRVWVVTANKELRIERIMARSGDTYEEVLARIDSQLKDEEYLKIADDVLINDNGIEELEKNVAKLYIKTISSR